MNSSGVDGVRGAFASSISSLVLTVSVVPIPISSALVVSGVLITIVLAQSLLVTVGVLVPLRDRHVVHVN